MPGGNPLRTNKKGAIMGKQIRVQTELIPAYAVIQLSGFLNIFAEESVESEVSRLLELRCPIVLADFSRVEHIDSAGITILVGVAARVRDAQARLGAYGLSAHYRKIFHMVGLDDYITVGEDRASLLADLQTADER